MDSDMNKPSQISNGDECKINNKSTEARHGEEETNGDQPETAPTDVLSPKIQKKLNEVIDSKGIIDYTILIEPGSSVGDNFMGFIKKVTITGQDKNKENITLNWIVKAAPQTDLYRKMLKVELLYDREIFIYETIFPTLAKFQEKKSVLEPFNNHPKYVFAYLEQYHECFGMENIKTEGYVMRNRQEPLNWHHVKLLMKTYAKFHAVSFAMKDQMPEEFAVLQNNMKDVLSRMNDNKDDTYKNYKVMMDAAFATLDPETDQKAIKKCEIFFGKFLDIFEEAVDTTNQYSVLGHGDSWVNNMLWKYEDPSDQTKPTNVCLLDFQLARYGSPVCDLSYFLFTCTDKSLRDEHYDDAIRLYYYTLCGHLAEMGSDPEKLFPFSALQDELKRYSIVGFFCSLLVISVITRESDEIPDIYDNSISEDDVMKKWTQESKNKEKYTKRIRDVIMDMCRKGYLDFLE